MVESYIRWISTLHKDDVSVAGEKGANLGEIYNAKFPVPQAFVVTSNAFLVFLKQTGLFEKIRDHLAQIDIENMYELQRKSEEIQKLIVATQMPQPLEREIIDAYDNFNVDLKNYKDSPGALAILKSAREPVFVSVRSSTFESEKNEQQDSVKKQNSFVNVKGNADVLESVKKVFSSVFSARAIHYRAKHGITAIDPVSVIVQRMINSEKSGVVFSRHPVTGAKEVLVEAVWGQGEGISSGKVKPDQHILSYDLETLSEKISDKRYAVIRNSSGQTKFIQLKDEISNERVLKVHELKSLSEYALKLEAHYGTSQVVEFAIENNEIFILETAPLNFTDEEKDSPQIEGQVIATGIAASSGTRSGPVKIVHTMEDLEKIRDGDILVTTITNPDMAVFMEQASAVITSEGGVTSHASIVCRELGIPAVVGCQDIMDIVHDSQEITVDGFSGRVFSGVTQNKSAPIEEIEQTKTEVKVMVDLPQFAKRASQTNAQGIGLVRLEGLIAMSGVHPLHYIREGNIEDYKKVLTQGLFEIAEPFFGKEIWVRTPDLRSDEYMNLKGSPEEKEYNPALGLHGARFSLANEELLRTELQTIKLLADKGYTIGVMFPQIISIEEVTALKQIFEEEGLTGKVKFGITIETPASTVIIKDLLAVGVDFVVIGTNDLTQYTLAVDRSNESVQHLFNSLHFAVQKQISRVIRECQNQKVHVSISGEAASNPELLSLCVRKGVDSVTVLPDVAREVSLVISKLEQGEEIEVEQEEPKEEVEIVSEAIVASEIVINEPEYTSEQSENQQIEDENTIYEDEPQSGEAQIIETVEETVVVTEGDNSESEDTTADSDMYSGEAQIIEDVSTQGSFEDNNTSEETTEASSIQVSKEESYERPQEQTPISEIPREPDPQPEQNYEETNEGFIKVNEVPESEVPTQEEFRQEYEEGPSEDIEQQVEEENRDFELEEIVDVIKDENENQEDKKTENIFD